MPTAWPEPFEPEATDADPGDSAAERAPDERVLEIVPHVRRTPPRIVGPGRRERAYLERVASLERALDIAGVIERGAARRATRLEREIAESRRAVETLEQREHRLILAMGALQNENERLRARLASARHAEIGRAPRALGPAPRAAPPRGGLRAWLRRWLGA
jgi:hypothetical protein